MRDTCRPPELTRSKPVVHDWWGGGSATIRMCVPVPAVPLCPSAAPRGARRFRPDRPPTAQRGTTSDLESFSDIKFARVCKTILDP